MSDFFLNIVNMSISASWIVLVVLLLRLLLKKAPKWITVLLWGVVAIRLICPFTMESVISLIPSAETISPEIMMDRTPAIDTGVPVINQVVNPVIEGSFAPEPWASINPLQIFIPAFSVVWIAGIVVMLLYTAISYWRVKRRIGTAVLLRDNIFQSESVVSPFVLGIIKPRIYLPFDINGQDMEHVIAHENAHIRRKDHWWKPLGFLVLTLHWFNPFVWLGYVLLCRDVELACDEKVVKELDHQQKADYAQALLTCSVNRRVIAACPLAFGELGVKDRVKSVLNYKKPAFWIVIVAILASAVVAVCFLTDPVSKNHVSEKEEHVLSETPDLLIGVLRNETKFKDEYGRELYLKDYTFYGGNSVVPETHTWVDFDSDGQNELVVYVTPSGAYLVFHVENDEVYGFQFWLRAMMELKEDGTFEASSGALTHQYLTLKFHDSTYELVELAYTNFYYDHDIDDYIKELRLDGKNATEEEFDEFYDDFCEKQDVIWSYNHYDIAVSVPDPLYEQFLKGEIAAYDNGQKRFLNEYLSSVYGIVLPEFYYTFIDMTGDGVEELCIKKYQLYFFTIEDGNLCHWSTEGEWYIDLLSNGALFYERHGGAPTHIDYKYYELDKKGDVSFEISFSWYDGTTVEEGKVYPDLYYIDDIEVTQEEFKERTNEYLSLGNEKVVWYNGSIKLN